MAMAARRQIKAVCIDGFETLWNLAPVKSRLVESGLPAHAMQLWFVRTVRDGLALSATDTYSSFKDVAFAALETVSEELGHPLSQQKAEMIMDSYNELTAQSDALEALTTLRSAGIPVSILTNGSEKSTLRLVAKNGLELYIHSVISVEQVRKWKPFPEVYAHAAQKLNLDPSEICLVSHHTWDIHGAASSGMATAWVSRGLTYKRGFRLPLITGHSLADVADAVSRLANVPTS